MDLTPSHFKSANVAVLLCLNFSGEPFFRKVAPHEYLSVKMNKRNAKSGGAFGAWKLTSLLQDGAEPIEIEDLRILMNAKLKPNRSAIKKRLNQMGAIAVRYLEPTQYKSFYNFLLTLKP